MAQKFSDLLRELADEADKLGYVGGGIIYFQGHQYTAAVPKESELEDPWEITRSIAFRLEADVNGVARQNNHPSGPKFGLV